jgi:hypothetical protein
MSSPLGLFGFSVPVYSGTLVILLLHSKKAVSSSENNAAAPSLALLESQQCCARCGLEHVVDSFAAQAGAFQVLPGTYFAGHALAVMFRDEPL